MWNNQKQQKIVSLMSNLQTYYHFKLELQNVDQHTGGKWLIHRTKRRKDNQFQSLELPCRIYIKESKGNMFNPIFKEKHPGSCVFAEPELLM